jgi:LmbE family N-acetylglucosaminyl deacetylase
MKEAFRVVRSIGDRCPVATVRLLCKAQRMATVVAFHAHPDDEALLTGGTLARLAAQGHRTVIVVACDGVMGEAKGPEGATRLDELRVSGTALGAARVEHLGYADSGAGPILHFDPPDRARFVRADIDEAAGRLADLLREEDADLLISYDQAGGYGHPDHVRVHEVGARAASLAGDLRVVEATLPREPIAAMFHLTRLFRLTVRYDHEAIRSSLTPRSAITHRVNVRAFATQKRQAVAAHVSQVDGTGRNARGVRLLLRLPTPIFGFLLGWEWFTEAGAAPGRPTVGDILLDCNC